MGTAVGGILGGGQIGVTSAINKLSGANPDIDTSGRFGNVVGTDSKGKSVQLAKYNPIKSAEDGKIVLNTTAGAESVESITFQNSFLPQLYNYAASNFGVMGGNMYVRGYENAKQHNANVNIDTYTDIFNEVVSKVKRGENEDAIRKSMTAQIDVVGEPAFLYAVTGAESLASGPSVEANTSVGTAEAPKTAAQVPQAATEVNSSSDVSEASAVNVGEESDVDDATIDQAVSKAYNAGWTLAQKHNPWIDEDTYGKVFDAVVTLAEQGYSEDRVKALYPNYEYSIGNQAFSAAYAAGMAMRSRSKAVQKSDVQSRKSFTTDDGYDTINTDVNEGVERNVGEETDINARKPQTIHQNSLRQTDGSRAGALDGGRTGTIPQRVGGIQPATNGEASQRALGKRTVQKIINNATISYVEVGEDQYSNHTAAIKAEYDALGIECAVVEGYAVQTKNGKTKRIMGVSSTLDDGTVIVRNNANSEMSAKMTAGHEMCHVAGKRDYIERDAFTQIITDDGVKLQSDEFMEIANEIETAYGQKFSIFNDYEKFYEEFCGYVSGDLYENNGYLSEFYAAMFNDPRAVEAAWAEMRAKFTPNNQNDDHSSGESGMNTGTDENVSEYRKGNEADWATAEEDAEEGKKRLLRKEEDTEALSEIVNEIRKAFGIPISHGKIRQRDALGIYKTQSEAIRSRVGDDLATISHELGHHLDKRYKLTKLFGIEELIAKMDPAFADLYTDVQKPGEAVAEFIRNYLRSRDEAKALYPDFFKEFETALSKEDLKKLKAIAKKSNKYFSSSLMERALNSMVSRSDKERTSIKEWISEKGGYLIQQLQNVAYPIKHCFGRDVYIKYTASLDSDMVVRSCFDTYLTDLNGDKVYDSLGDILQTLKHGKKNASEVMREFSLFLKLEHGLEYEELGLRMFADEQLQSKETMTKLRDELLAKHPEFAEVAERVYEYQRILVNEWLVKPGLLKKETAEAMFKKWPKYVPMYRKMSDTTPGGKAKSTVSGQKAPIKRAKGGGQDTYDPIENIMYNVDMFVKTAKRNEIMKSIVSELNSNEGLGYLMEKVPPDMIPKTVSMNQVYEELDALAGNMDGAEAIKEYLTEVFGGGLTEFVISNYQGKDVVTVKIGGKTEYYQVHDKALLTALTSTLTTSETNLLVRMIGTASRMFKTFATGKNLFFVTNNLSRDLASAYNSTNRVNPIKYFKENMAAIVDQLRKSDDYKKYKASGGGYSSAIANPKAMVDMYNQIAGISPWTARKGFKKIIYPIEWLMNGVENLSEAIETAPRLAEFKRTLSSTGSNVEALAAADEVTVNFKVKGKAANYMQAIPFLNATIQSTAHTIERAKTAPVQYFSKVAVGAILMTTLQMAFAHLNDEEDEYAKLSNYQKNKYYNFSIGNGKFIRIPKDHENAIFASSMERLAEEVMGEMDSYDRTEFVSYVLENILPPVSPSEIVGVGTYIDIVSNKDYRGVAIESSYMQDLKREDRYDENTTELAKTIANGKLFNFFPSVGDITGLSPVQIDHIIQSNTGGAGRVLGAVGAQKKDYTMGMDRQFVSDSVYSNDASAKFYDEFNRLFQSKNSNPNDGETAVEYARYYTMKTTVTTLNNISKTKGMTDDRIREIKRTNRDRIIAFMDDYAESFDSRLASLYERTGETGILPTASLSNTFSIDGKQYTLGYEDYLSYAEECVDRLNEEYRSILSSGRDDESTVKALQKAKRDVSKELKDKYSSRAS